MGQWTQAGFQTLEVATIEHTVRSDGSVVLTRTYPKGIELMQRFIPCAAGVRVENEFLFPDDLPSLPRVGVSAVLPAGFEALEWFGRGPHENYIDRAAGASVGRHTSTVTDQYVPYILPQEHGNHTDTRWMSVGNGEMSLVVTGSPRFEFSVSHLTDDDLFGVVHTDQLKPRSETFLTLDLIQRGVGSGACGPQTRPEYCVEPGRYRYEFFIGVGT